jgi:methylmalonyl-CoA mutase cobalamin-binding subunit
MKSHGDKVKLKILDAGVSLWPDVSARSIGRRLNMTHSAVLYHFGDISLLRDAVANYAVEKNKSAIIVSLIAQGHSCVASMSDAERQRHMKAIR